MSEGPRPEGPTGASGTGAPLVVKDAKGDIVGTFVSATGTFLGILESDGSIEFVDSVTGDYDFLHQELQYTSPECVGLAYVEPHAELLSQELFAVSSVAGEPLYKIGSAEGPLTIESVLSAPPGQPPACHNVAGGTVEHLFLAVEHGTVPASGLDGPLTIAVAP